MSTGKVEALNWRPTGSGVVVAAIGFSLTNESEKFPACEILVTRNKRTSPCYLHAHPNLATKLPTPHGTVQRQTSSPGEGLLHQANVEGGNAAVSLSPLTTSHITPT
ncbi:hypothetical protein ECG_06885 [Echinococcus granulosus]|nr:hypothetical protein ECG_06885 [Echinococcus granulosus]